MENMDAEEILRKLTELLEYLNKLGRKPTRGPTKRP